MRITIDIDQGATASVVPASVEPSAASAKAPVSAAGGASDAGSAPVQGGSKVTPMTMTGVPAELAATAAAIGASSAGPAPTIA